MSGLFLIILIVLLIGGLPAAQTIGISALIGQMQTTGLQLSSFATRVIGSMNSSNLICIPMFLFAGALMNRGGVTKRLFNFCDKLVGWLPGGLCHVNIAASLVFAGMSGSSMADLGGLGAMELKAMHDKGYPDDVSVAVTGCSSLLGPMIPPSVVLILYGMLTNASIGALFLAGIVPGILMALFMMVYTIILDKKYHFPKEPRCSAKELLKAFLDAIPSLMTVVIILIGIYTGIFTANEAGAIAALWALFLATVIYKEVNVKDIVTIVRDMISNIGSIILIMGFASILGVVLVRSLLPQKLAMWVISVISNRYLMIFCITVFLLICGCFMETTAAMSILMPILIPILGEFGFSLVHFGIIFELAFGIGGLTPPFGMLIFMMQRVSGMKSADIIKAYLPWIILMILCLLVIVYVPEISTFLPQMAGYSIS